MATQIKSRKASAEAQNSKAPSEEDFVGLVKYIEEREKNLSKYSDKLREKLQQVFNVFGSKSYCQICDNTENSTKHVKFRDEQEYLHTEETSVVNGTTVTYQANANYSHKFKPKIPISLDLTDTEIFAKTEIDECETEYYRLGTHSGDLIIIGSKANEQDLTGTLVWYTYPTKQREMPTREELKQLISSGRLPKFLAYAAQKLAEAEQEYKQVAEAAEKMAATLK